MWVGGGCKLVHSEPKGNCKVLPVFLWGVLLLYWSPIVVCILREQWGTWPKFAYGSIYIIQGQISSIVVNNIELILEF